MDEKVPALADQLARGNVDVIVIMQMQCPISATRRRIFLLCSALVMTGPSRIRG